MLRPKMTRDAFRLCVADKEKIEALAEKSKTLSKSDLYRTAIEQFLARVGK